jgi:hypothetical protein
VRSRSTSRNVRGVARACGFALWSLQLRASSVSSATSVSLVSRRRGRQPGGRHFSRAECCVVGTASSMAPHVYRCSCSPRERQRLHRCDRGGRVGNGVLATSVSTAASRRPPACLTIRAPTRPVTPSLLRSSFLCEQNLVASWPPEIHPDPNCPTYAPTPIVRLTRSTDGGSDILARP